MYHDRIFNRRRSVSGIIHTLLGVDVYWKLQIKTAITYESTAVEIGCMYKAVEIIKVISRYMEYLALHNGVPTVHWEENISCVYVVEAKIFTYSYS